MIYLTDDYVTTFQDTLGYIIGRTISNGYSPRFVERTIAYSSAFSLLEKSDITELAFSPKEYIFERMFDIYISNEFEYSPYDVYGWLGYTYIRLFFDLEITFESLFFVLPIDEAINMYPLFHEMDYLQTLDFVKSKVKHSLLDEIMAYKKMSSQKLSRLSGVSYSTISALRYGKRDINKLEGFSLLRLSNALRVKMESLLADINLIFDLQ